MSHFVPVITVSPNIALKESCRNDKPADTKVSFWCGNRLEDALL